MKNFKFNLILRIFLIVANVLALIYLYNNSELSATIAMLVAAVILQFVFLFNYVDQTNKELARFLLSIKHSDFSQTFTYRKKGKSFTELNKAFNEVIQKFVETRSAKEEQHRYLQTVLQHLGVGIISFDDDGNIELLNNAAKRMLKIKHLNNIKSLNKLTSGLGDRIHVIKHNEKTTIDINDNDEIYQLLVYATEFKLREDSYTLISLQNIQSELEEKEMEAWQKLIRVLTHEIMNSITPISSLAGTVDFMLKNKNDNNVLTSSEIEDISLAVKTINKRSEGLISFVNNYRNLTKVPSPKFEVVKIQSLFNTIEKLISSKLKEYNIEFSQRIVPSNIDITVDPALIEQVILNLAINSIYALKDVENPQLILTAGLNDRGKTLIRVIDNGTGLSEDVAEKIFIPFFTTKKEGSGIGLSLSRQIIRSHGGTIRVTSKPNVETVFTIRL